MKNILYLHRDFLAYDNKIIEQYREMGYGVYAYSINPQYRVADRFQQIILKKDIHSELANKQQDRIICELRKQNIKIDVVLVIAGQDLQIKTLQELRDIYPCAQFIWYIWDAITNLKEYNGNKDLFDTILSFDKVDSEVYNIHCLPLFYVLEGIPIAKEYEYSFIGTEHSARMPIIEEVLSLTYNDRKYIYLLNGGVSAIGRYLQRKYCPNAKKYLKLRPLSYDKTIEIMCKSKCVLDLPHSNQTGLTMRTIEALGASVKLITTNTQIVNYDFYNAKNIYILNKEHIVMPPKSFFDEPYEEIDRDIREKYSLKNWCKEIECYFVR